MPAQGKSATCLSYRLWIRCDLEPHNGHSAIPTSDRTAKIIESDESLTLSITNPLGTSDEIRIPARMALIPPLENRKLGKQIIRCESDPNIDPLAVQGLGSESRVNQDENGPRLAQRREGVARPELGQPRRASSKSLSGYVGVSTPT